MPQGSPRRVHFGGAGREQIFGVHASLDSSFSVFTFAALRLAHATMRFAYLQ